MPRILGLVVLLFSLLAAAPAVAHAALLASDPADGSVVPAAPATLTLTFDEPVSPTVLNLVAPGGEALPLGTPSLAANTVSVPAPPGLATGSYAFSWRVISADGHPVGGTVVFSIGRPSAGSAEAPDESVDLPVRAGIWLSRVLTYAALLGGVGGAVFIGCIACRAERRWIAVLLVAGLLALPIDVVFEGLDALGRHVTDILAPEVWREGIEASYGVFVALAVAALLVALVSFRAHGRAAALLSLLALGLAGAAFASTGHATAASPQWLMRPAVFLHTASAAFWIGTLLPLAALLRDRSSDMLPALRRFSATIPSAVAALLLSGILLGVVQVASPDEVLTTDYGRVLIAKLALVGGLLALAGYNRWRLTGPVLGGDARQRRRLVDVIALELALGAMVFAVVALWRFTPPPRVLLEAAAVPSIASLTSADGMAEVSLTPGHAGPIEATIVVMGNDMSALDAREVTLDLSNKGKGIEPIERKAVRGPDGAWHVRDLVLPAGGEWQVGVEALVTEFSMSEFDGTIRLRP